VRALRGVRITEIAPKDKWRENAKTESKTEVLVSAPVVNIGEALFGTKPSSSISANPFPTSLGSKVPSNPFSIYSSSAPSNPFAVAGLPVLGISAEPSQRPAESADLHETFASVLSLNNDPPQSGCSSPPEPWLQDSELPPSYPLHYLVDANFEILDKIEDPPVPTQAMDLDGGLVGSNQKEDKDVYESTIDKTFQKFADRLAQNPEQVIRYEFKGQPLLYSKHDDVGKLFAGLGKDVVKVTTASVNGNRIPRCGNCGAGRVFEVQLTPHAIMELEREETSIDGMEWGTIIVGVCERDCQQKGIEDGWVGYVEEWAGVQWEELNERR
jgi:pre-rRNA-processing protein TSR4